MIDQSSTPSHYALKNLTDPAARCEALNQAISQAAISLLDSRNWQHTISALLQTLEALARTNRVYFLRRVRRNGELTDEVSTGWNDTVVAEQGVDQILNDRDFIALLDCHAVPSFSSDSTDGQVLSRVQPCLPSPITFSIDTGEQWGWLVVEFPPDREPWLEIELNALRNAAALITCTIKHIHHFDRILTSTASMHALLEQIPAVIYTGEYAETFQITWISPQVEQYIGRKAEEFEKSSSFWMDLIYPNDRARVVHSFSAAMHTKSAVSIEHRIITKSGTVLWFRNDARIIFDDKNQRYHIQGVLQDIHQRKKIGAELNRLYHEEHQHRLMMEGLTVSSSTLSATMDIEKIPDLLLQELEHILPYDTATFWLVDGDDLVLSRARGYSLVFGKNIERHLVHRVKIEEMPSLKMILESGTPLIVEKVVPPSAPGPHSFGKHIRSWAGAPILVNGKPFGVFTIESREIERFTFSARSILTAICGQAGMSFQNAQSLKTEQELRARAELLQKATAALTAELELPQLLVQVMDYLRGVVAYDSVCLFLLEEDNKQARAVAGRGFEKPVEILDKLYQADDELFNIVSRQRSPLILADTKNDPRFKRWGDAEHIRGWMCLPLICREKVIGFMTVDSRSVNAYNEEDANYAQAFANQAASAIQMARLFTETQALAITDPLTGVFNRRHFFELVTQILERAREQNQTLSAIMIDIDNYKQVNDTYGHFCGDQILKVVVECFRSVLKPDAVLGRLGGDEFTVILPGADLNQAEEVAECLRSTLEKASIQACESRVAVTASFGVAEIDPARMHLDDMLNRADQALYQAKNAGRNLVVYKQSL